MDSKFIKQNHYQYGVGCFYVLTVLWLIFKQRTHWVWNLYYTKGAYSHYNLKVSQFIISVHEEVQIRLSLDYYILFCAASRIRITQLYSVLNYIEFVNEQVVWIFILLSCHYNVFRSLSCSVIYLLCYIQVSSEKDFQIGTVLRTGNCIYRFAIVYKRFPYLVSTWNSFCA